MRNFVLNANFDLFTISTIKKARDKSDHYTSRLLSWFRFAGIIEEDKKSILLIPTNRLGKEQGKIKKEETIGNKYIFIAYIK